MKKIIKTKIIPETVIPERTVEIDFYVAEDGTEFEYEWQCKKHEEKIRQETNRLNKRIVDFKDIFEIETEAHITLVYFENLEDIYEYREVYHWNIYDSFGDNEYSLDTEYCDFELFGKGWYILFSVYNTEDSFSDSHYCLNWKNYITKKYAEITLYKDKVEEKILSIKI